MPTVENLFKSGGLRWHPDADTVNAPEGVLLRADNLVPDRDGAMSLRKGSEILYSGLGSPGNIHSLHTAELPDGTTYRVAGVDDTIVINGETQSTGVTGTGDLALADDSYQIFMARGTTKKKWDGTNLNNWSIAAPPDAPTLSAETAITSTIADFNNSEDPAVTVQEGSGTIGGESDQNSVANEATKLTPDGSTYRGVLQRLWTTDQDFFNVSGVDGSETDLVDFYIKLENPRNVQSIKVVFGINDSSTEPFKDNRLEFEFDIKGGKDVPLKDLESEGYAAYETAVKQTISGLSPEDITGLQTPSQVKKTLDNVGKVPAPKSNAPADNIWSHLTVTRGQFKRIGTKEDRGWDTVRGFKIVYKTIKGKTDALTISDAIVVGGGDRCLTGTYKCVIRAIREIKGPDGNVIYYEKSPPSPESTSINLNHQTLKITVNGTTLNQLDPQAEQLWVYLFGGWMDSYYRFTVVPATPSQGMTIDELTTPAGSDLNTVVERSRIPSWGFTYCQLNSGGTPSITAETDLVITLRTTELEALSQNIRIEPYQIGCPDNVKDVAGPWNGRMFTLTKDGYVYPSNIGDPTSFNSYQVIDLTRYGDPYWIAKTGSGIYVGMEKDVVFLQGDGANSADLAEINLYGQPLNAGNPPIDAMHWQDGNAVIYRSNDGLVMMTGGSLEPLPTAGTSLLWRGQTRHDISINLTTGRFRCCVDNHMLYVLVPEGDETSGDAIWRYSFERQQWSRLEYAQVTAFKSIFNDPDGSLIAGDSLGNLWELESTDQDDENDIRVEILTPIEDGGKPFVYKDPMDLQLHLETGGDNATVSVYKDGSGTVSGSYTASSADAGIWRQQLTSLGKFVKCQLGISGSFSSFRLHGTNFTYRSRPQRMIRLDCGYIVPQEPGDVVWAQEVEFDANCSEDFTMQVYRNDTLYYTSPNISATAGKRDVYRIPVPRECKHERLRLVFLSNSTSGSGDVGFDPYMVRVRVRSTGNQDRTRQYLPVYPAGQAA